MVMITQHLNSSEAQLFPKMSSMESSYMSHKDNAAQLPLLQLRSWLDSRLRHNQLQLSAQELTRSQLDAIQTLVNGEREGEDWVSRLQGALTSCSKINGSFHVALLSHNMDID